MVGSNFDKLSCLLRWMYYGSCIFIDVPVKVVTPEKCEQTPGEIYSLPLYPDILYKTPNEMYPLPLYPDII